MSWQRIILLRHGETEWNRMKLFRGHSDIGLSQRGRSQARAAADLLSRRNISSIYTSPVPRAVQTAEMISEKIGVPFTEASELSDPDCGLWTGMSLNEARENFPMEFFHMENDPSQLRFPGGESVQEVAERVSHFVLCDLWEREEGDVLLVTHNFIFQVFTMVVLGCSLDNLYRVEMDNGAVSEYRRKGQGILVDKLNDNHHLMPISRN